MVSIENVTSVQISSYEELQTIIMRGSEQRHIAGTQMNDESSRSHLIFSIIIESTNLRTQSLAKGKVMCLRLLDAKFLFVYLYIIGSIFGLHNMKE